MKTIYYCECDSNNSTGLDLVFWLNEKAMATFTKRKTAKEWLIDRYHFIKDWFAEDIKSIKKHNKQFNVDTTITIDLYKFIVDDDFDIDVDNVWGDTYDHELIDSRYLLGRY